MTATRARGSRGDERVGLARLVAATLRPPDLHRSDPLPRHAPWGAVILARVVTYLAWAVSVAVVLGAVVVAIAVVTGKVSVAPPAPIGR
jgi:hypothetical protein